MRLADNSCFGRPLSLALWFGLVVMAGCTSTEEKSAEPDVEASNQKGGDDEGNAEGEESNGNGESQAQEEKQPISDDGYDDDWNNMGTQQQKQNNQANKNNTKNETNGPTNSNALTNEEPPLQNAPIQNAAQQVPAEEPPLDNEPAPLPEPEPFVQQAVPEQIPATEPVAAPPPPAPLASGAPLLKADLKPITSELSWLGYDYNERDSIIRIEMVTRGSPKFNIFQERNQANQPELVVRFFQTTLRDKVRRDVDASEFRSPVAFVRMRYDEVENSVDVIMTMRDAVQPRLYSKYGNVLLTFAIPDYYFGNSTVGNAPIAKAEMLPNANVMPEIDAGSDLPEGVKIAKAFVSDPGAVAFKDAPVDGGVPVDAEPLPDEAPLNEALPADFNNTLTDEPINSGNVAVNQSANGLADDAGEGDELFGDDNLGAQGAGEELDGENLGGEDFNFDSDTGNAAGALPANGGLNSAPAPTPNAAAAAQQAQLQQTQDAAEEVEDEETQQDDEEYEGDDIDSDSEEEEINKFDVRLRRAPAALLAVAMGVMIEVPFTATAVGQDDLEGDLGQEEAPVNQGQAANAPAEGDLGNTSLNGTTPNQATGNAQGEGNFQGEDLGDEGDFLGEGGENPDAGFGNANTGNGNFSNTANTGNGNFSNTGNTGNGNFANGTNAFSNVGNAPVNNAAPANNVAPVNNAPVNNVVPVAGGNAAFAGEPPIEEATDLAGEEQVGADTDAAPTPSSGGRPIRLDFRGAPLTEVIRALGDESRVNFVFPPDVGAKAIWINLQGVPFNDALRAVLESNALGMVELGPNLVRIDTLERLAKDKEDEERRRKAELKLRPTKVLVQRMSHTKAEDAAKMLTPMLAAAKTEDDRVTVQFDERTNSVIVNAPPNQLAMVKSLLERIDLETPQVKIASRVVEVIKTAADAFGISWFPKLNFDQGRGLGFGNLTFPNNMTSRYSVDAGGMTPRTSNMQFTFGSINDAVALDLALSMQESMGTSEVLQSTNIIVEDNTKAEIRAGTEDILNVPVQAANGQTTVEQQPVEYVLKMSVTPHITADGAVKMNIELESNDPAELRPNTLASMNTRELKTSLIRRSGETAVIGGMASHKSTKGQAGVPGLSRIPIIGALFRSSASSEDKRELMVMVTPTIMGAAKGADFAGAESVSNVASNVGGGSNNFSNDDFGEDDSLDGQQSQNNQGGNNLGNDDFSDSNLGQQNAQNTQNANAQNANSQNAQSQNQQEAASQQQAVNQEAANQEATNQQGTNQVDAEAQDEE